MHVELYDKKGHSLVPVPAEALEVLLMHGMHWLANHPKDLTQTRRALKDAVDVVGKAASAVKYHGADGGPRCEMERLF